MATARKRYDNQVLRDIENDARTFFLRFEKNLHKRMPRAIARILRITAVEPGPPVYPLMNKMTPRQRRYVWAKINEQGGPPIERTGAVLAGYEVGLETYADGGQIQLTNDNPAAPFVVGDYQQGFLRDNGWIQVDSVQEPNEDIAYEAVADAFDDTVRETL